MKLFMQRQGLRAAAFVLAGAMATAAAWAADLYFSGPSMAKPAVGAKFSGKGFAPNAALTVVVKQPDGSAAGYSAVAAADGSFAYTLVPVQKGAYTLTVTDSGGRALASAVVAVQP